MDHYLILIRCVMDDIPVSIHYDMKEAIREAKAVAKGLRGNPAFKDIGDYNDKMGIDATTPQCVSIVKFKDRQVEMVTGSFIIDHNSTQPKVCTQCLQRISDESQEPRLVPYTE